MNARTWKALEGSIKKWEDIVAGKRGDRGSRNCPLCREFQAAVSTVWRENTGLEYAPYQMTKAMLSTCPNPLEAK